ncbi:MAG: VWA domain-containing protein [Halobacteria archaeon]
MAEQVAAPYAVQPLWALCVHCMQHPEDELALQKLLAGCRGTGRHVLRRAHSTSLLSTRMAFRPYQGEGTLSVSQTIPQFLTRGRRTDAVAARVRLHITRRLKVGVLYDDSSSMTARWRNHYFPYNPLTEETAPQTGAKVGALCLLEAFGSEADLIFAAFGSAVAGPYLRRREIYRALLERNGSGGTRLDLALEALFRHPWHSSGGTRVVVVLTDGVPETGLQAAEEDVKIQRRSLALVQKLLAGGTGVVWVPILTDERLARFRIGECDAVSFSERLARMGAEVAPVKETDRLLESLFGGVARLLRRWEESEGKHLLSGGT